MKTIIKKFFLIVGFFSWVSGIFGQGFSASEKSDNESQTEDSFNMNAQMAMSSPDYYVTAGDIYSLAFIMGTTPVSYGITVDSTYKIRVANLGIINAAGLSFLQLKINTFFHKKTNHRNLVITAKSR